MRGSPFESGSNGADVGSASYSAWLCGYDAGGTPPIRVYQIGIDDGGVFTFKSFGIVGSFRCSHSWMCVFFKQIANGCSPSAAIGNPYLTLLLENAEPLLALKMPAKRVATGLRASMVMKPELSLVGVSVHASSVIVGWFAVSCVTAAFWMSDGHGWLVPK